MESAVSLQGWRKAPSPHSSILTAVTVRCTVAVIGYWTNHCMVGDQQSTPAVRDIMRFTSYVVKWSLIAGLRRLLQYTYRNSGVLLAQTRKSFVFEPPASNDLTLSETPRGTLYPIALPISADDWFYIWVEQRSVENQSYESDSPIQWANVASSLGSHGDVTSGKPWETAESQWDFRPTHGMIIPIDIP